MAGAALDEALDEMSAGDYGKLYGQMACMNPALLPITFVGCLEGLFSVVSSRAQRVLKWTTSCGGKVSQDPCTGIAP